MRRIILILLLLLSCDNQLTTLPETPSEVLNAVIQTAPHQIINVDNTRAEEILVDEHSILFDLNKQDSLFIGHIQSVTMREGKIYLYDLGSKAVYLLNESGELSGPKTREGQGPGEHNVISNLASNSARVYLGDSNNARINRYTPEMNSLNPIPEFYPSMISVSDEKIIYQNQSSSGFSPSAPDQGRIGISSIDDVSDMLKTIMSRIIPAGFQPQVFNHVYFSMNNHNRIAASYTPIPWIFLYDEKHELEKILVLDYSEFDKLEIPEMQLFRPQSNRGYGGQTPINHYVLMDNGDLFVTLRGEVIHLSPGSSGNYIVKKRFRIIHESTQDSEIEESFLWTFNKVFYSNDEYAIAFNPEYIYRILLNR
jgi:hypothetical protein